MKAQYIKRTGSDTLTLFFAGWGMDSVPFADHTGGGDLLLLYDYTDLTFDTELTDGYRHYRVAAWSMGVWAASCVVPGLGLDISESVAVAGTSTPVSERFGIPPVIFDGTLAGLNDRSLASFRRRMCGGAAAASVFERCAPERDIESLREELRSIGEMSAVKTGSMRWDRAVVTMRDAIFPAGAQIAAHTRDGAGIVTEIDVPHYHRETLRDIIEGR
ncbi:MAG: DUF452 family protein [Rikenellaceae bacterium]|jgi:biotin synthesis protein BioG|nr:DUF452 family protein [Rikenellaceae bacterium]